MNCPNKRIQTGLWKKVETKETQGSGNGLFAMEDVKEGDYIIKYVGRIVYEEQDNIYGMRISDLDLWIDPTSTGCPAKYMNYSCEPNCNLERWAVDGLPCMCFFAIEDIKSGEELTFDYIWELKAVSKYGMRISDMDLWIDPTSTGCPAKYMNHLCEPNCNLEQWAIEGLPRMCFFCY